MAAHLRDASNTRTLDHIVYLTPPGTLDETAQEFRDLGFNVLPGGVHAEALTANALVVIQDHVYLELIHFTHPASYYEPGSPLRLKRDSHPWSESFKKPGFVDFAFLGNGSLDPKLSVSNIINKRAREKGIGPLYSSEQEGGRTRPDGEVLKWLISAPEKGLQTTERGVLPFFCGDVTPRSSRVPTEPPSNVHHPSGAIGLAYVQVLVNAEPSVDVSRVRDYLSSVIGESSRNGSEGDLWQLDSPNGQHSLLLLSTPNTREERCFLEKVGSEEGIYEVAFHTQKRDEKRTVTTKYGGRITWVSS